MQKVTALCHVEENTWIDRPDLAGGTEKSNTYYRLTEQAIRELYRRFPNGFVILRRTATMNDSISYDGHLSDDVPIKPFEITVAVYEDGDENSRSVAVVFDAAYREVIERQAKTRSIKTTIENDFELEGAKFRVYRNTLWADGGEHDDMVIADLSDVMAGIEDWETEVEIVITDAMIQEAQDYQEYLAQ